MSVYRRFHGHGCPSLITFNTAARRPIFRTEAVARLMRETLERAAIDENVEIVAWVIMPDHLHAVVAVPFDRSLGRFVQLAKGRFAREFNLRCGGGGAVWQGRYHERALKSENELFSAIDYVHRNPVAAGIAGVETDYDWSSASQMLVAPPPFLSG